MAIKRVKKCRTKKCNNPVRQMGVCSSCFSVIRRAVLLGQFTWTEAEERGLVKRVRKPCPMHDELAAIIDAKGAADGN